jgi:glycosyltransferase involved in cell wall biosynthesis
VGYTFFEDNHLTTEEIENAKRYWDVVVTGSTWCQEVLEAHGVSSVRTVIQGIDPEMFSPSTSPRVYLRDDFVVFSGGKLELRKGQDIVIRAYKVLQDRHADVMLVNSWFNIWETSVNSMRASPLIRFAPTASDHVDRINQVLADNGVDLTRVTTLRARPNTAMAKIYQSTDVGLFPNRCEGGTNLVLMEYMACGKPAVVSFSSGHTDVVNDENAILIRGMRPVVVERDGRQVATWAEPDLEETIERLEWAYQHSGELHAIGAQAGEDLAKLTWKHTAEQLYEILGSDFASSRAGEPRVNTAVASANLAADLSDNLAQLHEHIASEYLLGEDVPPAALTLLPTIYASPEFAAIRDRVSDTRPMDSWQQDGLHFFVFVLRAAEPVAVDGPTAVFTMHPDLSEPVSAVMVTPRPGGAEAEVKDLRNLEVVYAAPIPD